MSTTATSRGAGRARSRRSALDAATASRLAAEEYERWAAAVAALEDADWHRPTACPAWDVHLLVCHVLGMALMVTGPLEVARQQRAAARRGGLPIDALTSLQVDEHRDLSRAELVARTAAVGPRAARGRRRMARLAGRAPLGDQPVDDTGALTEPWTLDYLLRTVLTRDTWMHRSDLAEAVGRPMALTPEHDGVLVADVVQEWADRHGRPFRLRLTGPAGGTWERGSGGEEQELDAVAFCRVLSGRGTGEGLLRTRVPF